MTLILKHDLDMVKMYCHTKNEVSMSKKFKSYSPNRHTHTRHDENITSTAYVGGKNLMRKVADQSLESYGPSGQW